MTWQKWSYNQRAALLLLLSTTVAVKTKPCLVYTWWNEAQQHAIMGLAGLLLLQIILLDSAAAVATRLSQVTGPLSLKPVVTGAELAQVWAESSEIKSAF